MKYIGFIHKEGDQFVCIVPDLNYTSSFGDTFVDAIAHTEEACELYCEDLDVMPESRSVDALYASEEIEEGATPHVIEAKVTKKVRVNIMIDKCVLDVATQRAKEAYAGNRSAYIQQLIVQDTASEV